MNQSSDSNPQVVDDTIDFAEMFRRIMRGMPLTLGLALLCLAATAGGYLVSGEFQTVTTSARVIFSFPNFERGEYPDNSKFSQDDLRSPEIVAEALKRKGFETTQEFQSTVRTAISIDGIIPDNVIKERDKQRSAGQTPRLFVPDEYILSLTLSRKFPLTILQREQLLGEIVSIYREKFFRTYVSLPTGAGKAFESLAEVDYFDYDIVLNREGENITKFLTQMSLTARAYRSPRTNLTFNDLLKQSQLFTQIRLNEVLGLIRRDGLSRDRKLAMVKMDYNIKTLSDAELHAKEEEKVVKDLLEQTQNREQKYTLGLKSQSNQSRTDGLMVDQNLVDSLLANDAYNFLVRQALTASLKTRHIQSDKAIMQERRSDMQAFLDNNATERAASLALLDKSLEELKRVYNNLVNDLRLTYEDYQRQQYSDAVRISMGAKTSGFYRSLAMAGIAGLGIGLAAGLGLSLLGISGRKPATD